MPALRTFLQLIETHKAHKSIKMKKDEAVLFHCKALGTPLAHISDRRLNIFSVRIFALTLACEES